MSRYYALADDWLAWGEMGGRRRSTTGVRPHSRLLDLLAGSLPFAVFLLPSGAAEFFREAARAFSEDREPSNEQLMRQGQWDSANISLWAKYFRARAAVARIIHEPHHS